METYQVHVIQFNERVAVINNVATHICENGVFTCGDAEGKVLYWQRADNIQSIIWKYGDEQLKPKSEASE